MSNATQATVFLAAWVGGAAVTGAAVTGAAVTGLVVGAWGAAGPHAAMMMAAEAPSPSSRLEIVNCAPPPNESPALHGTPVVRGRIR